MSFLSSKWHVSRTQSLLGLITVVLGFPKMAETIFLPSFPQIATIFQVTDCAMAQVQTLVMAHFACGIILWGYLSDGVGRKPCIIAGLMLFMVGSCVVAGSGSFPGFILGRCLQSLGLSIGSVLGQTLCRDVFQGPDLRKAYAMTGMCMALFPALSPWIGYQLLFFGVPFVFMVMAVCALILGVILGVYLPETRPPFSGVRQPLGQVFVRLMGDAQARYCGTLVGLSLGITFIYFAESPFYFIQRLGIQPGYYSSSFLLIAAGGTIGGLVARYLAPHYTAARVMTVCVYCLGVISFLMVLGVGSMMQYGVRCVNIAGYVIIMHMGVVMVSSCLLSNTLSVALLHYSACMGTASSLFGFYYYSVAALCTGVWSLIPHKTSLTLPLGIFILCGAMGGLTWRFNMGKSKH